MRPWLEPTRGASHLAETPPGPGGRSGHSEDAQCEGDAGPLQQRAAGRTDVSVFAAFADSHCACLVNVPPRKPGEFIF